MMALAQRYEPGEFEPRLQAFWQEAGVYQFSPQSSRPVFSIDTPPPTVSGNLHLGHTYSYTHQDIIARYHRMKGENVFYPMGYDDNGLPTERLVERQLGRRASEIERNVFIQQCLQISAAAEKEYQALFQRLGLSVDWRFTYRTIEDRSRRISQKSFLDLYRAGLVYRQRAPSIWCPECRTAIAQADINDLERKSEFVTLAFGLADGSSLPIATTRPELLPACVAVFVHPEDRRFQNLVGKMALVPLFGRNVPILADLAADPDKGTGAVMCCTFGDAADKDWWQRHRLPLIEALDRESRLTEVAGEFAGMGLEAARAAMLARLEQAGQLLARTQTVQVVRVHERCDTPVEYLLSDQWFIRVLDYKEALLEAGEQISWRPAHMKSRYRTWVENLAWDWCISRQRVFGVPFPLWYCEECGQIRLADESQLPVDPWTSQPLEPCSCGSSRSHPEEDVLDTWATSSMSPQIVGGWLGAGDLKGLYEQVFPFSLRPQSHEIIRTWAYYTLFKSQLHFNALPWKEIAISGWGIAGEGMGKISKSRGGGPVAPFEMIRRYSADAVRYWAASTGLGKDAIISEERIQAGARLVNKLWNVARFSERFISGDAAFASGGQTGAPLLGQLFPPPGIEQGFTPADRWMLSRAQRLIRRVTGLMENYDYAAAKGEIEAFFWSEFADNYLEMAKQRLYAVEHPQRDAARFALFQTFLTIIQLLAPFLPFITEAIYQDLFMANGLTLPDEASSIHSTCWPAADPRFEDDLAEAAGEALVEIASGVRRYKSERNLPLSTELAQLQVIWLIPELDAALAGAESDLKSATRARSVVFGPRLDPGLEILRDNQIAKFGIKL